MTQPRAKIIGTGMCVPDRVVTNDDLAKRMNTTDEWIRQRTGIEENSKQRPSGDSRSTLLAATNRRPAKYWCATICSNRKGPP